MMEDHIVWRQWWCFAIVLSVKKDVSKDTRYTRAAAVKEIFEVALANLHCPGFTWFHMQLQYSNNLSSKKV